MNIDHDVANETPTHPQQVSTDVIGVEYIHDIMSLSQLIRHRISVESL